MKQQKSAPRKWKIMAKFLIETIRNILLQMQ